MKRLVLLVEGKGDEKAVPTLAARVLSHLAGDDCLFLDGEPFRASHVNKVLKEWPRTIQAVLQTRANVGAILVVLDGDADRISDASYVEKFGEAFCARHVAEHLASSAQAGCAGKSVSIAIVLAMKELECWAVSVIDHLGGVDLSDGTIIPPNIEPPSNADSIRDGKGRIEQWIDRKYKPTVHQRALAKHIPIDIAAERSRSFRRFVHAIKQLIEAARAGQSCASPP